MKLRLLCSLLLLTLLPASGHEQGSLECGHCAMARQWLADESESGEGVGRKYAPDRLVDILHLKLEITPNFSERTLVGHAVLEFSPIANPLKQLHLSAADLRNEEITSDHAIEATENTDRHLIITFAEAIPPGENAKVEIQYEAEPKDGLFFRTAEMGYPEGDTQLWTQGEPQSHRHWFPSHDYPNEKFTTEVVCHVPEGMVALSNGKLIDETHDAESGLTRFHWLQDKPHVNYLISLVAGYFEKEEDQLGDLHLAFYAPPSGKDQIKNSFVDTKKILEFFQEEIGVPYPWDKYYNVCAIDYMFGGMENTSITTLTVRTLFSDASENLRSSRGLDAHEVAHQWFGNLVTCKDWSHLWLNEGFATYYSLLYDQVAEGDDFFKLGLYNDASGIFQNDKDIIPIVNRDYADPMEQFSFRAYPKGGWVLHMIRTQLGENLFRECIKTYLERNRFQTAVTQDLLAVFEELSGQSWDRFFDQWVYLSGYPELNINYEWDQIARQVKLTVQQVQEVNEKRPIFHFPLPVRLKHGEETVEVLLDINNTSEDFYIALPEAPEIVRIDPEITVLAKVNFTPPTPLLMAQLEDADDAIGRMIATKLVSDDKTNESLEQLTTRLREDSFFAVRTSAAQGIAEFRSDEALQILVESLDQEDARVRQQVVRSITSFYGEPAYQALRQVAEREQNPDIRTIAIEAIGKYSREELRPFLLSEMQKDSYGHEIAASAIQGMHLQDDPYYVEPLLRELEKSESKFSSGAFARALQTLAFLARDDSDKTTVRTFLTEYLDDQRESVQHGAIQALADLQDPKAIPILDTLTAADRESPTAKQAAEAVRKLRELTPSSPQEISTLRSQIFELRNQLEGVSEEMTTLRKRFEEAAKALNTPKEEAPSENEE